jgi:RNA ligase (TIGR02306 family)
MSTVFVEIAKITEIKPHPNADRLEIAIVNSLPTLVPKGQFVAKQHVVFFPPDILIPPEVSQKLEVQNYLKHGTIQGQKCPCRVAACRLRQEPSYGFIVPVPEFLADQPIGSDVSEAYQAEQYVAPPRLTDGELAPEVSLFHKYTTIEHFWKHNDAFPCGMPVRITEKIHGTNSRVGLIRVDDETFEFMAGSHRTRRRRPTEGYHSIYWEPLEDERILNLLTHLCNEENNKRSAIVFGEIYGHGVQDMDYGVHRAYRVFDISVDGQYLDWGFVKLLCRKFNVDTVPVLYEGPFHQGLIDQYTYGPTTLASPDEIKSAFKDREGCVITPWREQFYAPTGGRLILKSVSADYLARKGGTDNE